MFDIGWSEILVIAVVAIIVVGPKELPRMLRTFGKTMGTVRRTANDFKRQFDEALREAEHDSGLEETRKSLQSIGNPIADLKKDLSGTVTPGGSDFLKMVPGDASTSATAATAGAKGVYAEQYAKSKGYDYSIVPWIEGNQPTVGDFTAFARSGAGK